MITEELTMSDYSKIVYFKCCVTWTPYIYIVRSIKFIDTLWKCIITLSLCLLTGKKFCKQANRYFFLAGLSKSRFWPGWRYSSCCLSLYDVVWDGAGRCSWDKWQYLNKYHTNLLELMKLLDPVVLLVNIGSNMNYIYAITKMNFDVFIVLIS